MRDTKKTKKKKYKRLFCYLPKTDFNFSLITSTFHLERHMGRGENATCETKCFSLKKKT
jgi:hypothetical protein